MTLVTTRGELTGLEGNGMLLVRERALASRIQHGLERLYQLERVADVHAYLEHAGEGGREGVLLREADDGALELAVFVPSLSRKEFDVASDADLDPLCQIIEGVSHFVYLTDRARQDREATQLELELQAEVDKFVVLASSMTAVDPKRSAILRSRLYEEVAYSHDDGTELGDRYRAANRFAQQYVRKLEVEFIAQRRFNEMHAALRRFYRMGLEEKLRVSRSP